MKTILCYGDSNTYGYNPENGMRYDYDIRWTGVLQNLLGSDYRVIEEGLNSRTTVLDDPYGVMKNGKTYLTPCIESHYPFDLVIVMLGSNDLKERFHVPACDIAKGAANIVKIILDITREKSSADMPAKVILVSPIHIGENIIDSNLGEAFGYMRSYKISRELADKYKEAADNLGVYFIDAALIAEPSEIDALHLSEKGHKALGKFFSKYCIEILS